MISRQPIVVGCGANLGDRLGTLRSALVELRRGAEIRDVSNLYETPPVGGPDQPDYLNGAILITSQLAPPELLDWLLEIERRFGRVRSVRNAPRTLDLDVLWAKDLVWQTPGLVIPHPRLSERAFALLPLLDVCPDASDPRSGLRYAELLPTLDRSNIRIAELAKNWNAL